MKVYTQEMTIKEYILDRACIYFNPVKGIKRLFKNPMTESTIDENSEAFKRGKKIASDLSNEVYEDMVKKKTTHKGEER